MKVTKKSLIGKIWLILLLVLSVSFLLTQCQEDETQTTTATTADYIIASSNFPTSGIAGTAITGDFTIKNQETGDGSATVDWTVYQSTDATYDTGDTQIATGSQIALTSGTTSGVIPLSGNWSSTADTYYLIIRITASDDTDSSNNETVSSSIVISNPDYTLPSGSLTYPTGGTPGGSLSGTFTITNSGATSDTIAWTVYISSDTTFDAADITVQTGTTTAVAPSGTSGTQSYSGTWPSGWYLLCANCDTDIKRWKHLYDRFICSNHCSRYNSTYSRWVRYDYHIRRKCHRANIKLDSGF